MVNFRSFLISCYIGLIFSCSNAMADGVRIKELARVEGVRDNALVGYGLVVGLAGTGDSSSSKSTIQSIVNSLANFSVNVKAKDIRAKNVAAVMVTATLQPFASEGDKLDVSVSSIGDAKSLLGGTLLLTPLMAADNEIYSLSQGQLLVGGYKYDLNGSLIQKNHPTVGVIPRGGTVEQTLHSNFVSEDGNIHLLLKRPDFSTADSIVNRLTAHFPEYEVTAIHPGKIKVNLNGANAMSFIAAVEHLTVTPDIGARIVINERTGTIVSGANVMVSDVIIAHSNLNLKIETTYRVSQPNVQFSNTQNDQIQSLIVPETKIGVSEDAVATLTTVSGTNVSEVVTALKDLNLKTRDIISILQAIKQAGSLHADLIIQ